MLPLALLAALAAEPGTTVTPFRTSVSPRVDPVFGDVAALRSSVDRFLGVQGEMDQVRAEFSTAVHGTLTQLSSGQAAKAKRCPPPALASYGRALFAGGKYLTLGRQLEARFREIRRADELGDIAGVTPDYRAKIKRARDLYLELLRDYREMRVAFYDQLGAEMRFAGCDPKSSIAVTKRNGHAPDPSDPTAWDLEDPTLALEPTKPPAPVTPTSPSAPSIWITIDNSHCTDKTSVTVDGATLGTVAGHKKASIRTRSGPHELCILPASDKRTCGDAGTMRRAYLSDGWTMVVRCAN